ncbi:hypothetical protein [Streptomyces sp. NPDC059900]|uniref:hypothetical protein n=1 Tax=Streptomyces sp. NPDC059900 TaxID=3155816 RepID=UPI003D06F68A
MTIETPHRPTAGEAVEELTAELWKAVSVADEIAATDLVLRALDDGTAPDRVLIDVM